MRLWTEGVCTLVLSSSCSNTGLRLKFIDTSQEVEETCLTRICTMARNLDATAF